MLEKNNQIEKEEEKFIKVDFFTLTKKYWKDQVFFYITATISCFASIFFDQNLYNLISERKRNVVFFWQPFSKNHSEIVLSSWKYTGFFFLASFLYFLTVFLHVWVGFYLQSKLRKHLKELIVNKMFKIEGFSDKQKVLSLLNYNVKFYSENVFYIPNQIYYTVLEISTLLFGGLLFKNENGDPVLVKLVRNSFFVYFSIFLFICLIFQFFLYHIELKFFSLIENETKDELFLVENSNLIIKKNESAKFLEMYNYSLNNTFQNSSSRDLLKVFSFAFPSHFLIKFFPFFCSFFITDLEKDIMSFVSSLNKTFSNVRKVIERGRDFPLYLSSKKKINDFFSEKERDDKQNGKIFAENIWSIELRNINFAYSQTGRKILDNFSFLFKVGTINQMNFPNGFGKSTIINLISGLISSQHGEIIINEVYNLEDIDLNWWRSNISYAEHHNLISSSSLSTGQKQLIDLENTFSDQSKQIFIFDEADSNLDYKNRNEFLDKLRELSTRKIVILSSHHNQKKYD